MAVEMIHLDHMEIQDFFEVEQDDEDILELCDDEDENGDAEPDSLDALIKRIEKQIEELESVDSDDE